MKAKDITTSNMTMPVIAYDRNWKVIMWDTAYHKEVLEVKVMSDCIKVKVDIEKR